VTGTAVEGVELEVVCVVKGGVEGVLLDVDDEQGETGVERNKILTGVGT